MKKLSLIFLVLFLPSCSNAKDIAFNIPENEKQRLFTLNFSVTTEKLYSAYMSSDIEQRRLAEMYVAGVIDSSEGTYWCGFNVASPSAIQEQVFSGLKKALKNTPGIRASKAIKMRLENLLPCKEQK